MRFNNGKEMLEEIVDNCRDLYSPEKETYVFLYNDDDSIAYYSISKEHARQLAEEVKGTDEYWCGNLGPGGYIIDGPSYEYYKEGDETPLEWCERMYDGEWIDTNDYLEWFEFSILAAVAKAGIEYEQSKMIEDDSKVEIDICDNEIWLGDYSKEKDKGEFIKKICDLPNGYNMNLIINECNEHGWSYVIIRREYK